MSKMSYRKIKRLLDVFFAVFLLLVTFPLLLLIALLIKISDGEEIFLSKPLRIGESGKLFFMYKFRSMIPNAHEEILHNPKFSKEKERWKEPGVKLSISEDPRITIVGKFLRRCDLDELPQIMNVILGEMSIVGPRPMYQEEIDEYLKVYPNDKKLFKEIQKVKPGITGLWQVSGRNRLSFRGRLIMDSGYVSDVSFWKDLKIFLKTPYVVLTRKGAHE